MSNGNVQYYPPEGSPPVEPQYTFGEESNVLWVDTVYWTLRISFPTMAIYQAISSRNFKISYLPGEFYLNMVKNSPRRFKVELVWELDNEVSASEYDLQISFSIVASPCPRKITYFDYDNNTASVDHNLEDFLSVFTLTDLWMIKCVVWLREKSPLDNDRKKEHYQLWKTKLNEVAPTSKQYEQMALIMGRESFRDMFTGLQDCKFADIKATLLARSFRYSDELLSKISREEGVQRDESIIELGRQLGYIKNGQERCISNKDCILLYASAFFCGLSYLKMQCSDYIKMNLDCNEVDFFIDVMIISDMVNDSDLKNCASSWYLRNIGRVLKSIQWNNFKNRNIELARGFQYEFLRYERHDRERVDHIPRPVQLKEDDFADF